MGGSLAEAATGLNSELQALDSHQLSQPSQKILICSSRGTSSICKLLNETSVVTWMYKWHENGVNWAYNKMQCVFDLILASVFTHYKKEKYVRSSLVPISQLDCTWGEPDIKGGYEVKVEESEKAAVTQGQGY